MRSIYSLCCALFLICKSGALWTQIEVIFTIFLALDYFMQLPLPHATPAVTNSEEDQYDSPKKITKTVFLLKGK